MSKKVLEAYENRFSQIFKGEEVVPFHRKQLPWELINDSKKYTVLGLSYINNHFVLVQKTNGFYAIPGGGTEKRAKSREMLETAFRNVGCKEELNRELVNMTLESEMDYISREVVREYLEETPLLMLNPVYFGHQKTKKWQDEIVFISNTVYHFDTAGHPEEVTDLSVLSKKQFQPIGKSVSKMNPVVVLSVKEMINHLDKVVYTHQVPIARFLLSIKEQNIDVCFAEKKLKMIAKM